MKERRLVGLKDLFAFLVSLKTMFGEHLLKRFEFGQGEFVGLPDPLVDNREGLRFLMTADLLLIAH